MALRQASASSPSGRSIYQSGSARKTISAETLTFEVVGFRGAYHTILGRPCYAKFMAVPNYTYLKMKMSGPRGVITVGSLIEHTFDYDVECVEHVEALVLNEMLVVDGEAGQ
jgi:hypothetical protein